MKITKKQARSRKFWEERGKDGGKEDGFVCIGKGIQDGKGLIDVFKSIDFSVILHCHFMGRIMGGLIGDTESISYYLKEEDFNFIFPIYSVNVTNIGEVYEGESGKEARLWYAEYKRQSREGEWGAAGEEITLFKNGEVMWDYKPKTKLALTRKKIRDVLIELKKYITDESRASEEDELPSILVTVGADSRGWNYQIGDNSYKGDAYGYLDWGVASLYRRSNCREVADDIFNQLEEQFYS